jgi:hypothetical protein
MPQIFGKVSRALPSYSSDGTQVQQRVTGYGDIVTTQLGDNHSSLADEGSYFKATNSTIGTGTSVTVPTTYTAASPMFMIVNTAASASGKRIFVDYVRLFVSSVGGTNASAASQSIQCAVILDDQTSTTRYSSGGSSAAVSVVNVNSGSSVTSSASVYFGNSLTATTPGNPRQIVRNVFKFHPAAPTTNSSPVIVGDNYSMDFGEHSAGSGQLNGFTASAYAASVGPAVIGWGHCLLFYLWYPAASAITPTYEFEIGWWER